MKWLEHADKARDVLKVFWDTMASCIEKRLRVTDRSAEECKYEVDMLRQSYDPA